MGERYMKLARDGGGPAHDQSLFAQSKYAMMAQSK